MYFVYITNCSEHNWMRKFNNLDDALQCCEEVSQHNTPILIKGTALNWKNQCKKKK